MYKLNPSCFPVKGFGRSLIYNFTNCTYFFIPNDLYTLLTKHITTDRWFTSKLSPNQRDIITEYIDFLIDKECVINCATINANRILTMSKHWSCNSIISTLNIQIKEHGDKINAEIQQFCINNHIRNVSIECTCKCFVLSEFLKTISDSFVDNVELYLQYGLYQNTNFDKIFQSYPFISKIVLLGANGNSQMCLHETLPVIKTKTNVINSPKKPIKFILNKNFFFEALTHNTFYNKRVFIDELGYTRTHPTQYPIFNIKDNITFNEEPEFWKISKNNIQICKDCEYRYMCYDSRLPNTNGFKWFYQNECAYNPLICKWKGEIGYIPVKKCCHYSKRDGYIYNIEKIKELNKQIWGEDDE